MSSDIEAAKKRLRQHLNPSVRGDNTDKVIDALASGPCHMIDSVEAVYDSAYVVTATGRYLDELLAGRGLSRPEKLALPDDIFREIGIEFTNRKQVRDVILSLLRIIYGEEYTRATSLATVAEPYSLSDGDNLLLQYDDGEVVEIFFDTSQFQNINTATSQEVADAIIRSLRSLGKTGSAVATDTGSDIFVELVSSTDGPASSVRVLGGSAQNILRFPEIRQTTGVIGTQWTVTVQPSGAVRFTWSGGASPSVGKVLVGDYVNILGAGFDEDNKGTFTITAVESGLINESYFEIENPFGVAEVVAQGTTSDVLFYNPKRSTINDKVSFATLFQTEARLLEIFIPATTKVVRRNRIGAAHIHDSGSSGDDLGPYCFDETAPYQIGGEGGLTTVAVDASTYRVVNLDDSSSIPDQEGFLVFGFGTAKEEGPIKYTGRPSNNTVIIDPDYVFEYDHAVGTDVALIASNSSVDLEGDGADHPFYLTDIVAGRLYAEELIELTKAAGINTIVTILYPGDEGLGKWLAPEYSEKTEVWGG